MAASIIRQGGEIRTGVKVTGILINNGSVTGVMTGEGSFKTGTLIMATGHSARDTWDMLQNAGVNIIPKPFQMGLRIEHPQDWLDHQQFGDGAGHAALGAAEYKLATRIKHVPVFSFCMCPGGQTIPTVNEKNHLCINGMSMHKRDSKFSSSGIVVTLDPAVYGGKDLDSCMRFVRSVEQKAFTAGGSDYTAPAQSLSALLDDRVDSSLPQSSYAPGITPVDLNTVLPPFVMSRLKKALPVFNQKLPGFLQDQAVAIAPESRASSPVRIERDKESRESNIAGLYPAGEGSGYAGGIMSAALDGLNTAVKIISSFAPPR
jgi:uncharacterized FAD-dependent dehydrogenase